jgi:bifunctional non-homologous end joining protein LigD
MTDVLILAGRSVMPDTLAARRELLTRDVLPRLSDLIREAPRFDASLSDLIRAVREQGLEGLVAKRLDSVYEPGQRSGGLAQDADRQERGVRHRRIHEGRADV